RLLAIDQCVLVDPAHAAGIRSERDERIRRKLRADRIDAVEHQLLNLRPPGRVVQDDVDERVPHVGYPANRCDVRRSNEGPNQWFRDLGLEQLRTPRPLHVDDDLRVRDIRNRVERGRANRVETHRDANRHDGPDEQTEADDRPEKAADHWLTLCAVPFSLYSESMKKLPNVTTCSPGFKPSMTWVNSSP